MSQRIHPTLPRFFFLAVVGKISKLGPHVPAVRKLSGEQCRGRRLLLKQKLSAIAAALATSRLLALFHVRLNRDVTAI